MTLDAEKPCPFCTNDPAREGRLVKVFLDAYPVSPGHLLIVPKRHVAALWDLTVEEYDELFATARTEAAGFEEEVDGWNLGVNVGAAGGQTVWHVHLHLIPRRNGDTTDPRGGVRWVVPENAKYWP